MGDDDRIRDRQPRYHTNSVDRRLCVPASRRVCPLHERSKQRVGCPSQESQSTDRAPMRGANRLAGVNQFTTLIRTPLRGLSPPALL